MSNFIFGYVNLYIFTNIEYIVKMYLERNGNMDNKELRKIPVKNYMILGAVIVVTLLLLYYFYMWVDVYKESKNNIPIMDKYMTVINYNELDNYLVENPDTIVYVSVLEDDKIREFEKKIKVKYKNNELDREILYMNITDDISNKSLRNEMNSKYFLNNLSIIDVPCVLVFNGGVLTSIYSIADNDYNIERFIMYLNNLYFRTAINHSTLSFRYRNFIILYVGLTVAMSLLVYYLVPTLHKLCKRIFLCLKRKIVS